MITHGIDVSKFQGTINWQRVKENVDFAIIRCGFGQDKPSQDDPYFKRNADECTRLNIPFGVYLYSYATNEQEALGEARHVLRLIKDYKMAYPIYYDLEDNNTTGKQSNEVIANIAKTFADELEKNNYYVGMYASLYWWRTKLTSPIFNRYTRWIAYYGNQLNFDGEYDMWQYSSTGSIPGITSMVDLNYCYKDFPEIIRNAGLNNFNNQTETNQYQVGDHVRFQYVFLTSESTNPLRPYRQTGIITRIVPNARNPYLIGQDDGWVNDQVIEGKVTLLSNSDYQGNSLVDALNEIGVDSSFENRRRLAMLNGITSYQGTNYQNTLLLNLLKEGQLVS
ncbi:MULTISPECIES: glycoside hydrolase family 25 protein [Coprobacillaceae]|uniref:glycoside hydrolase family 25 protein n=1 Tax=Coprobacillaceae TaxID=2810280 RepID=UPI000E48D434|nr:MULTISPECIES: glycoside hydrolase family 25 protein [Coprobacillaceae]RHM59125.1 hypothetical protein DWZ53_10195 [Coprobacillus sp. AF33-1AC]RHS91788.1 hypothetical protein DW911_09570 [Erysipelatoclostridium sp. AM42-17]